MTRKQKSLGEQEEEEEEEEDDDDDDDDECWLLICEIV